MLSLARARVEVTKLRIALSSLDSSQHYGLGYSSLHTAVLRLESNLRPGQEPDMQASSRDSV